MKNIIFTLLFTTTILFSCKKEVQIPDEVQPYVDSFYFDAAIRNIYVYSLKGVYFVPTLDKGAAGRAVRGTVYICEPCWEWQTLYKRKPLIYHELGHALLGRHDNGVSWPSIMNGLPFDYYQREQYYIDELFYGKP